MTYYVTESFNFGGEEDSRRKTGNHYIRVSPFLFDEKSRDEETVFEVFYVDNAENYFRSKVLPEGFVDSKEVQGNVVKYFASFDEAIQEFNVEELPQEEEKVIR